MNSYTYRKIWEGRHGKIPKDSNGRTYEIHHIDGNRNNNNIKNLICVSIEEHYNLHYNQKDYGACVLIAKRMNLPPDHLSEIQKGIKRPGVGGTKKGTIPWNKGKKGYKLNLSEEGRKNMAQSSKKSAKIKDDQVEIILKKYTNKIKIDDIRIGKVSKNGKIFTYKRSFCEFISKEYGVTIQAIERLIRINVQKE
jgi:hypothetical protein